MCPGDAQEWCNLVHACIGAVASLDSGDELASVQLTRLHFRKPGVARGNLVLPVSGAPVVLVDEHAKHLIFTSLYRTETALLLDL